MFDHPQIVVATDFSECSDLALRAGEILRRKCNGKILLTHVAALPDSQDWISMEASVALLPVSFRDDYLKAIKDSMRNQARKCEAEVEVHVLEGHSSKTLAEFAKEKKVNLIVMGHKGAGRSTHFLGSYTTKILTSNEAPLLVINRALSVNKVAGLVEIEHPVQKIISVTEELGRVFDSEVSFISVWQDIGSLYTGPFPIRPSSSLRYTEEEKETINATMKDKIKNLMGPNARGRIHTEVVQDMTISGALTKILEDDNIDIAVLSRNRQNLIEKIFIGSVARRVLDTYGGNFLVLPPESDKMNG